MAKVGKVFIVLAILLLVFTSSIGCSSIRNSKNTFGLEQFKNEMKERKYKFDIKNVQKDFLPTTRKRMLVGKEALDIYVYSSNLKMERDAKRIDSDGSGYKNLSKSVKVDWVAPPHFYKRGRLIVQYVGTDKKIMQDLKDIFGEQFAGGSYSF